MRKQYAMTTLILAMAVVPMLAQTPFKPYPVSPRKIVIGKEPQITLCKDGEAAFEVVKPANPAAAKEALKELLLRLEQITGRKVVPVAKASGKVPAFYLGTCPEAEKLGLNPEKLDRDGFYIKTDGNRIFITGCDGGTGTKIQKATLFGVYDFLERFAGVRYYFPGEIGTIVPKKKNWTLPSIDITERPDMQKRRIYCYPCARPPLDTSKYFYPGLNRKNLIPPAWRNSTRKTLGANHGINALELGRRFSKTHPEYFALTKDGKRFDHTYSSARPSHKYGHLCFSSEGLKEEVYQDAVAALTGKPASTRGVSRWNYQWDPEAVSICPNDGIYWCQCPACKKIEAQGAQAINDHIWKFRVDIANKLKKNNIPGYVTANSYAQFALMPSMELPDNINVSITPPGPWSMNIPSLWSREQKRMKDWVKRVHHKITIGTYATKALALVPEVPNFTPRAVGAYFKAQKDYIYGCFFEVGSDHWMFDFMNCYVFSKVLWNTDTDVEALIDEHCRLMFGKAAPQMNRFYREIEDIWMHKIMKETIQTSLGEKWKVPTLYEIWTRIYSPQKVREISTLLDQAEKAVASDPESLKRVKFIRKEIWEPVETASKTFSDDVSDRSAWTLHPGPAEGITLDGKLDESAWKKAEVVWLNANPLVRFGRVDKVAVQTRVRMLQDGDNFYFGFEADEPKTDRMAVESGRKADDSEIWRDNAAEIFLSADFSSEFIYQFIFNSAGAKCDLKNSLKTIDPKFDSGFEVKTQVVPGKMWTAEVRIPRKALPELKGRKQIVGNFTRRRVLKDGDVKPVSYVWFPKAENIPEYCGVIQLEKTEKPVNLIQCGDFDGPHKKWGIGAWSVARRFVPENEVFVTRGTSLRLEGNTYYATQKIPVQPGHRYKVSFYIRTENLKPGVRATVTFGGPPADNVHVFDHNQIYLSGTHPWRRIVKTFQAPEVFGTKRVPQLSFGIGKKSTGKCWIDHVELIEVK